MLPPTCIMGKALFMVTRSVMKSLSSLLLLGQTLIYWKQIIFESMDPFSQGNSFTTLAGYDYTLVYVTCVMNVYSFSFFHYLGILVVKASFTEFTSSVTSYQEALDVHCNVRLY